jgi:hypothetical protein
MERGPIARSLRWTGSWLALGTLALPLGAALLLGSRALGMSLAELSALRPIRVFALALAIALVLAGLHAALDRSAGRCAASLGGLALLAGLAARALLGLAASADLGEGEPPGAFARFDAGPLARPPAIELRRGSLSSSGTLLVAVDGREQEVLPGKTQRIAGIEVRVVERGVAPRLVFESESGTGLDEMLVKLPRDPDARAYLETPVLPHRFHLSPARAAPATADDEQVPAALHLRVTRGKLKVLERDLAKGEVVKADHVSIKYLDGLPWARIEVARRPGATLLCTGLALLALGAALELRAWRARARRPSEAPAP